MNQDGSNDRYVCLAENLRNGKVCNYEGCGAADHRAHHHRLAWQESQRKNQDREKSGNGADTWSKTSTGGGSKGGKGSEGGGKPKGKGGKGGKSEVWTQPGTPEDKARKLRTPCRYGAECGKLDRKTYPDGCGYYHPPEHYKGGKAAKNDPKENKGDERICTVCKAPLKDKKKHPDGRFCKKQTAGKLASLARDEGDEDAAIFEEGLDYTTLQRSSTP